jgi:hypothetical protein
MEYPTRRVSCGIHELVHETLGGGPLSQDFKGVFVDFA